jgi:hypothetical protein
LRRDFEWARALGKAGLDADAHHVGLTLATFMDKDGSCWPSIRTLEIACDMPRKRTLKAIERLERSGWLLVEPRGGPSGSHRYTIAFADGAEPLRPVDNLGRTPVDNPPASVENSAGGAYQQVRRDLSRRNPQPERVFEREVLETDVSKGEPSPVDNQRATDIYVSEAHATTTAELIEALEVERHG